MFRKPEAEPAVPCACCGAESTCTVWEVPMCHAHWSAWSSESPTSGEVQAAAPAHLVATHTPLKYPLAGGPTEMITLVDGAMERSYRLWTDAFVKRHRPAAAVGAAP